MAYATLASSFNVFAGGTVPSATTFGSSGGTGIILTANGGLAVYPGSTSNNPAAGEKVCRISSYSATGGGYIWFHTEAGTNSTGGFFSTVDATNDSGTNPMVRVEGSRWNGSAFASITTRPIFHVSNNGTNGIIVAPSTAVSIRGTTTNDSASAGFVGETVISNLLTGSAVSLTTATAKTVTSISLTAGDWDVSGAVVFKPGATTSVTIFGSAISATTDAVPATIGNDTGNEVLIQFAQAAAVPATDFTQVIPRIRVSVASTTTVFLTCKATFTVSTLGAYGTIRARRIR